MKKIIASFMLVAWMLACAPLQSVIQTAVSGTLTAVSQTQVTPNPPAPQPTGIKLDWIPCQPGDLPEPYHCGQIIHDRWVEDLPQAAVPEDVIVQRVGWDISNNLNDDFVLIALFKSNVDLQKSFDEVTRVFPTTETAALIGDRSAIYIPTDVAPGFLTFTHCSALVVIQFGGSTVTEDMLMSYALRIDERLKPLACQPLTPSEPPDNPAEKNNPAEPILYYYFVDVAENAPPEGSVEILPGQIVLAPAQSGLPRSTETAADLASALQVMLNDPRNMWTSTRVGITSLTFSQGAARVVLDGEYFGAGDIVLIAARMQILMTVFADPLVQTATVTLNGENISNLGISQLRDARPASYAYPRAEIEYFMAENKCCEGR